MIDKIMVAILIELDDAPVPPMSTVVKSLKGFVAILIELDDAPVRLIRNLQDIK